MDDRQLLNLFKTKREEIAYRESKALFYVFSNDTLERTAASRPTTLEELKEIKGWGQKKIAAYGPEYLAIIASVSQSLIVFPFKAAKALTRLRISGSRSKKYLGLLVGLLIVSGITSPCWLYS